MLPASLFLGLLVLAVAAPVSAQPVAAAPGVELRVGSGWGRLWDDETNLGTGVPITGGVALHAGSRLRLGADADWLHHNRNVRALNATGNAVSVFGRGTVLFGAANGRVRPFAGAGFGLVHSTGEMQWTPGAAGTQGGSVLASRTTWNATSPAYDLHAGLQVPLHRRLATGVEYRWRATVGSGATSGVEPPFIGMQAVAHLDLRLK